MPHINWQRTVVRDGWHNMGTDLCFWRDCYWLVYSRNAAHASPEGTIVVMRSLDLKRWHPVSFIDSGLDDRDPKLLATDDKLYVYFFGCRLSAVQGELRQVGHTYLSSSENGVSWTTPVQIHKSNYWLWSIRQYEGAFYSPEKGGELLTSSDCLSWKTVSRIPLAEDDVVDPTDPTFDSRTATHKPCNSISETDFIFRPDGELWCVSRTNRDPDDSIFYWSKPPYREWDWVDLKTRIHCPAICDCHGVLYVAGRRSTDTRWKIQPTPAGNTAIFVLEKGKVEPFLALASEGDAAYPGLIATGPHTLVMSYYSQHAYLGGVVPADTNTSGFLPELDDRSLRMTGPADIFLAEIDTEEEGHELRF